jgi:hypothetical protein
VAVPPERLGYTRIPLVSYARSVYGKIEPGRGNLVLVFESTAQLEALRQSRPSGIVTPRAARTAGLPPGSATTFRREAIEGTSLPAARAELEEAPSLREQRMRLGRPFSEPTGLLSLPLGAPFRPVHATPAERAEYATLVIPAEVLEAVRGYYARRGAGRVTQAEAINAAAYAVFTAKLRSLPFGRQVTGAPGAIGSPRWVLEQLAASELEGRGVRGSALVPGQFPPSWTPPNVPGEIPVVYSTVLAVLYFVHGPLYLRSENFDNLMREQLGWHHCGTAGVFTQSHMGMHLPASNEFLWCPPPRSFPIAPPAAKQRTLGEGAVPSFPQHRRPSAAPPAEPPRYRRF